MYSITVIGKASGKIILKKEIEPENEKTNLMELLRFNGINIASSCFGEGICKKCLVFINDKEVTSCQKSLSDFTETEDKNMIIEVSYL